MPRSEIEQGRRIQESGVTRVGLTEGQVVEKPPLAIWVNDGFAVPIGRGPVPELGVHSRTRVRAIMLIVREVVITPELHDRDEPMPMQHGDVGITIRRRVPAEKVIVISTDLARRVMVADIVVVGLWQRHVYQAEDQYSDPQVDRQLPEFTPISRHGFALTKSDLGSFARLYIAGKSILIHPYYG
jgi:hypothetical protein